MATSAISETDGLVYTFLLSLFMFAVLLACFEKIRHMKSKRVPPIPPNGFLGWVKHIVIINDNDFLYMVGLDGYVFLRFIKLCLKASIFMCAWGFLILAPVYSTAGGSQHGWQKFTLSNVASTAGSGSQLWVPAFFSYMFSGYVCYLFYHEYKHFVQKRLEFLVQGDPDTPKQTHYSLHVENIPPHLRSTPALSNFFDQLFPDNVYSVSICLDLHQLEDLVQQRENIRHLLEKSVAIYNATASAPTVWISNRHFHKRQAQRDQIETLIQADCSAYLASDQSCTATPGMATIVEERKYGVGELSFVQFHVLRVHAIEHYTLRLWILNYLVKELQLKYDDASHELNALELERIKKETLNQSLHDIHKDAFTYTGQVADSVHSSSRHRSGTVEYEEAVETGYLNGSLDDAGASSKIPYQPFTIDFTSTTIDSMINTLFSKSKKVALEGVQSVSNAQRTFKDATKTLLLKNTSALVYQTSSTAFITLKTRVSTSVAYQMLLSHDTDRLSVKQASSPSDVIWQNVTVPQLQITAKKTTAKVLLVLGAIFWSFVVSGVHALSSQNTFSEKNVFKAYESMFNYYMAVCILLSLLTILPLIFDAISRNYECVKTESEIQNSIMIRYFYYQVANVYVNVTAGTIFKSINEIINNPQNLLSILGSQLPSVSVYFTSIVIVMAFVCVMFEFIRFWPMICYYSMTAFRSRKKATRRELRNGAFAPAGMLYGWIYPSLLMIFIIEMIYSCIAPFLTIFATVYFSFAYLMYKYQLLYVYVNKYQSGGFFWYSVFNFSMVSLLCGVLTLLGYLSTRKEYNANIFYFVLPHPFLVVLFWRYCNETFRVPSTNLSLSHAGSIDAFNRQRAIRMQSTPLDSFNMFAYCQPALTEKELKPEPYRLDVVDSASEVASHVKSNSIYNCLRENEAVGGGSVDRFGRRKSTSGASIENCGDNGDGRVVAPHKKIAHTESENPLWAAVEAESGKKEADSVSTDLSEEEHEIMMEELRMNEMLGGFTPAEYLDQYTASV